jgi:alpha-tubulin suppressor-like RCC1 family protein/PKD repeat protein
MRSLLAGPALASALRDRTVAPAAPSVDTIGADMRPLHVALGVLLAGASLAMSACSDSPTMPVEAVPAPRSLSVVSLTAVPAVSVGGEFTCALTTGGIVSCWGSNSVGQTTVPSGLLGVAAMDAGRYHTCALTTDGTVSCWLYNDNNRSTVPSGLSEVTAVSAGGHHTCALTTGGTVSCWGYNGFGQIAVPTGLSGVTAVTAGGDHTCALTDVGTVSCWGYNGNGETTVPIGLSGAAAVSAGDNHTCVLTSGGTVRCWGRWVEAQTAVPNELSGVEAVSAGGSHTCALITGGTVRCWGSNGFGQSTVPNGLSGVAGVSAGGSHTCALTTSGTVSCWGNSANGQTTVPTGLNLLTAQSITFTSTPPAPALFGGTYTVIATGGASGQPVTFSSLTPSICTVAGDVVSFVGVGPCTVTADQVGVAGSYAPAAQVTQAMTIEWSPVLGSTLEAGDRHTCAIREDGHLLCWGFADMGQTTIPAGLGAVAAVTLGGYHTCAIKAVDGGVVCWGANGQVQTQVPGDLGAVRSLGAGTEHTCAIGGGGGLRCWGRNVEGQTTVPADVRDVLQVDGGVAFTCALLRGGTVRCWGSNIDQNTNPSGQIDVPAGLSGVTAIAVGFYGVCALTPGGVVCWGRQTPAPADVGQVVQIGSTNHNCALRTDASLRCWGFDIFGQIAVPAGLGTVTRVAVGGYHTCALRQDATVVCWGIDQFGELQVPTELRPPLSAQTVTFTSAVPSPALVGGTSTLLADGGGSGNPITFGSLTPTVCTVASATATLLAAGTCTLSADQAGSALFAAAPQATQSFEVAPANTSPVARAGGPYLANEGAEVTFDGTGSEDAERNIVSYAWNFGDGQTFSSTDASVKPTHAYADNGTFTVTLTVTDAGGLSNVATSTATISNVAPTGTFTTPATGVENTKIFLALTPASDPGSADVLQYAFDCGDGKGYAALTATNNRPCVPADNGTLAVKGKVQDDDGGVTEYTGSIVVTNVAPTATFTYPTKSVPEGSTFNISLTKPVDAAADLPTLTFRLGCFQLFVFVASQMDCLARDNGALGVSGRVIDKDQGETAYTGSVTITNVAPSVVINSVTVGTGRTITLTYTIVDPAGVNDMTNYCVSRGGTLSCGLGFPTSLTFGEDTTFDHPFPSQTATRTATWTYTKPGNYTIIVRASDNDGGTGSASARVRIN